MLFSGIEWTFILEIICGFIVVIYLLRGVNMVDQWDRKPVKRFGRFVFTLGPGLTWVEPFTHRIIDTITLRDQVDDLHESLCIEAKSAVQTHDNVPITFGVLLTWRVAKEATEKFFLNVKDGHGALLNRALTIISELVGNTELDSILHDRQTLYSGIMKVLQTAVAEWGIVIVAVELKDVAIADASIQEAISMKARAQKEAEAELTRAKMQTQIAEQLKEASKIYDADAWKLKGIETLLEMCRSAQNNTIMVPTDLVQGLAKFMGK